MILPSPTTTMSFVGAGILKQVGFMLNPSIKMIHHGIPLGPMFMSETVYSIIQFKMLRMRQKAEEEMEKRRQEINESLTSVFVV